MKKKVALVLALLIVVALGLFFVLQNNEKNAQDKQDKLVHQFLNNLYTVKYDDKLIKLFEFEATSSEKDSEQRSRAMDSDALDSYVKNKFQPLLTEDCFQKSNKNRILTENLFYSYFNKTDLSPEKITIDSRKKDNDTIHISTTIVVNEIKDEEKLASDSHKVDFYLKEDNDELKISYFKID